MKFFYILDIVVEKIHNTREKNSEKGTGVQKWNSKIIWIMSQKADIIKLKKTEKAA